MTAQKYLDPVWKMAIRVLKGLPGGWRGNSGFDHETVREINRSTQDHLTVKTRSF